MKSAQAIVELTRMARGERRYSLENRETEEVLNMTLALLVELSVALDRIDRLERLLAGSTGIDLGELRAMDFADGAAGEERSDATQALIARVLRIRLDPRAAAARTASDPGKAGPKRGRRRLKATRKAPRRAAASSRG